MDESEWQTRKRRIDTRLRSLHPAWQIVPWRSTLNLSALHCHAVTEFPTANGPADYEWLFEVRRGIKEKTAVDERQWRRLRNTSRITPAKSMKESL